MPARSTPCLRAAMAMVVAMQVAKPVATRSVGEKASPRPWLSLGASVARALPDGVCTAEQWSSPWYSPVILTMAGLFHGRGGLQQPQSAGEMKAGLIALRAGRTNAAREAS